MGYTTPMKINWLYRNVQAQDNLEILLVSAVSSLLLLRFGLYLSGYPQVGGGALHIAHMLYGGLFMLAAIVIQITFIGKRATRAAAIIGGAGFGIFIDELGKFITRDNNYFFRPTVGIIYAIFMILYLLFNFISRRQKLSSREYQLNALSGLQEAVLHDMAISEKYQIAAMLRAANPKDEMTIRLKAILDKIEPVVTEAGWLSRYRTSVLKLYQHFWKRRGSSQAVAAVFIIEALIFVVVIFATLATNVKAIDLTVHATSHAQQLLFGQLGSSVVAAVFAVIGAVRLPQTRMRGYEWFRRATLVTIFLTEFFIFTRIQFGALPGFVINVLLLAGLNFAIAQERRSQSS